MTSERAGEDGARFRRLYQQEPALDHRGHLFDRSVENGTPVLRCRYGDCSFVWWPDQHKPSRACRSEMSRDTSGSESADPRGYVGPERSAS